MKKIRSIAFTIFTLFVLHMSSGYAETYLQLSDKLQATYNSWNILVNPYIEYTDKDGKHIRDDFFTTEDQYKAFVQIPTGLASFDIYLPTYNPNSDSTNPGSPVTTDTATDPVKYIKFSFNREACTFPIPRELENEAFRKIFNPQDEFFIATGIYTIDMQPVSTTKTTTRTLKSKQITHVLKSRQITCLQCILTNILDKQLRPIVSISNP